MSRYLRAPAAAALGLALALPACGSDGEPARPSAASATSAQETPAATTTEPQPEPITGSEERWRKQIESYSESLDREIATGGAITHATMGREARLYLQCAAALERAGDPGRFEPALRFAERACDRLERAAGLLERAIASSERGGFVYAGTPEEKRFERAIAGAAEAAGNGQYDLQRALGQMDEIERNFG